jgi:Holliday junction resolvase-like predicted endonuclease
VQYWIAAGLVVGLPPLLIKILMSVLKQAVPVPTNLTLFLLLIALVLTLSGIEQWKGVKRAEQGAKGEEDVAESLSGLISQGWTIEYGTQVKQWGDVDIVCISPKNRVYAIDVKSHSGTVLLEDGHLKRRIRTQISSFEKDFLKAVKGQASEIQKQKRCRFVTPILVFSRAKVMITAHQQIQGVYIVAKLQLVSLLQKLG